MTMPLVCRYCHKRIRIRHDPTFPWCDGLAVAEHTAEHCSSLLVGERLRTRRAVKRFCERQVSSNAAYRP